MDRYRSYRSTIVTCSVKALGAIWGAIDPQSDVLYLYSEYVGDTDPAVHAAALRSRADWIPGLMDPTANGRKQVDGQQLVQIYRRLELNLFTIDNPVESGILSVWQRMHSGRLKVFASLSQYLDQRRLYRRAESGQIVQERDHLRDALRCLVVGGSRMRTKPQPVPSPRIPPRFGGSLGWMR